MKMTLYAFLALLCLFAACTNGACYPEEKQTFSQRWHIDCSQLFLSPNKQWAVIEGFDRIVNEKHFPAIRILNTDGVREWQFDFSQLSKEIGLCDWFSLQYWSPDERYLYIAPDNCSHTTYFDDGIGPALYRVELSTGQLVEILPITGEPSPYAPFSDHDYYSFAFSSDGVYLAYFQPFNDPIAVSVMNLNSGEETVFKTGNEYPEAGCLNWLPNEDQIVFFGATTTLSGKQSRASFFRIDVGENEIQEIVHEQSYLYCYSPDKTDMQPKENRIVVRRVETSSGLWDYKYLNIFTGEILPVPSLDPNLTTTP